MTEKEAADFIDRKILFGAYKENKEYNDALTLAINALRTESCEDAISRQAVLKQTYNWSKDEFLRVTNPFDYLRKRINSLPSVTPAEKVGHWTHDGSHWKNRFICSECGYKLFDEPTNYCPNCGAKMAESEVADGT